VNVEEGGGGGYSYQHRPFNITDSLSQIFSTKSLPPTAFILEPVRCRVAGMKKVLLMITVVMDQSVLTADFGVL
jgi:hypothetical protein